MSIQKSTKSLCICADDFAMNEAVSHAIIDLTALERVHAVSCMTTPANWPEHAKLLQPFVKKIDIGLHFNLTYGKTFTRFIEKNKIHKEPQIYFKKIDTLQNRQFIAEELKNQLDAFEDVLGKPPDFIDGHLHVHQLKPVREELLKLYSRKFQTRRPYLRATYSGFKRTLFDWIGFPKTQILLFKGAMSFKKMLLKQGVPHNSQFVGVYNFAKYKEYPQLIEKTLCLIEDNTLMMCHPAVEITAEDTIGRARLAEYGFLKSLEFGYLLQTYQIQLSRMSDMVLL